MYTCLFGGYEPLCEQPVAADSDLEFVAFTDDPALTSDTWDVRLLPSALPADRSRSSRRPKLLAHEYLPDHDESLYIDNSVLLIQPPEVLFADLLPGDVPFAMFKHSNRGALREEYEAVVAQRREVDVIAAEQLAHYERIRPDALEHPTLWGGVLLRRHHDPAVVATGQAWWEQVLRYSRRDQLSLPYVLLETGVGYRVHPLHNRESPYHRWPREDLGRVEADGYAPDLAAGLRAESAQARRRAERAEQDAKRKGAAAERAERRAERAERRAERLERQLAALRASTSWRITRPLRAATGWARRTRVARRAGGPGRRSG